MANPKDYPPLAALRAFEAVGRLHGIRRAAKELTVDHAVVSRHIRSLDAWVGAQLLTRNAKGYSLTELGSTYHEQISSALGAIASATSMLMSRGGDLKLSIECIPGFASLWLSDHLGDFISKNSDIDVDFRPSDHSPDFRGNLVDTDIRCLREWEEAALPKSVRRFEFVRPTVFPVASPACAANLKPIDSAEDFLSLPLLHEESDLEWRHWLLSHDVRVPDRIGGRASGTLTLRWRQHARAMAWHWRTAGCCATILKRDGWWKSSPPMAAFVRSVSAHTRSLREKIAGILPACFASAGGFRRKSHPATPHPATEARRKRQGPPVGALCNDPRVEQITPA